MVKAVAINGSPRLGKGNTAMLLAPFIEGMEEAGAQVELHYASRLKVKPCSCSSMNCWYSSPGECTIKDDMQLLYPSLRQAEILVLATPVYIPLPGAMQDVINRLCPLVEPYLEFRQGRTRARRRPEVGLKKIALVSTGGWWEKENMGTVVRIAKELAEDISVEFAGAVIRPHAFLMKKDGSLTKEGQAIVGAACRAGRQLVEDGRMKSETLEAVSHPLISEEELRDWCNRSV
jgi:multimeric flavodoxin WrbA